MSKIQWTEKTWNPVTGCTRVSAGCDHCYAATMTRRLAAMGQEKYQGLMGKNHFNGVVKCHPDTLEIPMKVKKSTMWFVNSMSDLFHEGVLWTFVDQVFETMAQCPQHTFQILTKRPFMMSGYLNSSHRKHAVKMFQNVWLGTSVENQKSAEKRIPELRKCPAVVRFLSVEPLLERVDLDLRGIHWVIVGGESGTNARPMEHSWLWHVIEQCKAASVPLFVKQLGSCWARLRASSSSPALKTDSKGGDPEQWNPAHRIRQMPSGANA